MARKKKEIPVYGTVIQRGVKYYRTRLMDADGRRVALYAQTPEELYEKVREAQRQIEEAVFRKTTPTVAEYCARWLIMQSGKVRATTLADYTSKEEKATFRTQHPTKYPIKQANHNSPKADVKTFADLIYAADRPEYKGIVTIARRPKGTSTMETVASVPAEQVGEWLSQMHVSADADYYITKAQFKAAQTWDTGELFALNAIWVDIDAHEKASNCPNPEDALSLLSQGLEIWTELPEPNIVVYSGRGFHLIWLIGQCAASLGFMASEISKHIGNAIQNLLTDLQIIGYSVDSGYCSNIAGLTRIPGTFNTHANNYCTCEIRHSVRMSLVEEYKDLQFYPRKSIATSEPCYRYMPTSAQAAGELRVNALLKLLELRTNWEGYRDYFLLILFSACQMAGYPKEEALRLALKANTQLKPALSEREVQSLLSTAVKKHYKMKNAYIVEKLNLTADEQAAIGISAMPTGAKKRGKNQARDEKIAAKRRKENRMIMRFHILGWSIGTIAKKVNRCYNTVKKRIDEYTEKLEELFSQHEICMLFRQRAKRIVAELKKCATPISFFEDLIYYAKLPCAGELLHLVKHDEGLSVVKLCSEEDGQLGKKHIEVGAVIFKDVQHILRDISEINNDMAFILVRCELLGNETLANAPCSVNQQRCRPAASLLPRDEVIINFPPQHTDSS